MGIRVEGVGDKKKAGNCVHVGVRYKCGIFISNCPEMGSQKHWSGQRKKISAWPKISVDSCSGGL